MKGSIIQITGFRGVQLIIDTRSCNSMFNVALLRHPAIQNHPGTCYGRSEMALQAGWEDWVDALCAPLLTLSPARIWSSSSQRCALPAKRLSGRLQRPLILDNRLLELSFGEWEGQRWDAVPRASLNRWAADPLTFSAPGGETGAALIERVTAFGDTLMKEARSCIVISHGGPLKLLAATLTGKQVDLLAPTPGLGSLDILRLGTP